MLLHAKMNLHNKWATLWAAPALHTANDTPNTAFAPSFAENWNHNNVDAQIENFSSRIKNKTTQVPYSTGNM